MIEAMKQAIDYIENVPDDRDNVGHIDRKSLVLSLRQAIAGLESQEPVALETVYETIIQWDEGGGKRSRRDLARRIIDLYTHPPQRTEQEEFKPDWDAMAVMVEEQQRMAKRIEELEAMLEKSTEQEPVATVTSETGADITMSWWHEPALPIGTKLFTHPPQRTWVGLTKDEVDSWNLPDHPTVFEFAQFIESKLKEKNI